MISASNLAAQFDLGYLYTVLLGGLILLFGIGTGILVARWVALPLLLHGRNVFWQKLVLNVASLKQAEAALKESETFNRAILDAIPDLIIRMHRDGSYLDIKPTTAFPIDFPNFKLGENIRNFLPSEAAEQRLAAAARALETGEVQVYEFPLLVQGQPLWQEARIMPLGPEEVLVVIRDLTQRKQMEEALRQSEARLAMAQQVAQVGYWEFDLVSQTSSWSEVTFHHWGLDPTQPEPTFAELLHRVHPDDLADLQQNIEAAKEGIPYVQDLRVVHSDGSIHYLDSRGEALRNQQGQVVKLVGTSLDITERKQVEAALQESEARFRELAETVREGFFIFETEASRYSYINPACEALTGKPFSAFYQEKTFAKGMSHWLNNIHPDDRDRIEAALQREREGDNFDEEYRFIRPDGEILWLRSQAFPIHNEAGTIVRIVGTVEDITDRKQAEIALQASEARFQEIAQTLNQVSYVISVTTGQYLYISPAYEKMWGFSCESLYQDPKSWLDRIYPEDLDYVLWGLSQLFSGNQKRLQYRIISSKGEVRWIESESLVVRGEDGNPLRIVGLADDITDRKQLEESLQLSEARYRGIVEDQMELICRYQPDGTLTFANEAFCRYFGLNPTEVLGSSYEPLIFEADRERVVQLIDSMSQDNPTVATENRVFCQGEVRWTQWNNRAIFDQGHFIEFQAVGRDITERKQAEAEIQQLNQQLTHRVNELQTLFEVLPIGVAISEDPDCRIARINPCLAELLRVALDANASQSAPVDERPTYRVYRDGQEVAPENLPMQYAATHNLEVRDEVFDIVHPDGTVIPLLSCAAPLRDVQGKVRGVIGGFVDITDRKQMEEALRTSEERFRRAFDDAPIGVSLVSPDGMFLHANAYYCEIVGYSKAELLTLNFQEITHPADLEADMAGLRQMIAGETRSFQMEKRYITKQGTTIPVLMNTAPIRDQDGQILYFVGHIRDIRDRLKIERMKDEFISIISHELRTPLTSIRGALGILSAGVFNDRPEKAEHMLQIALNNSDRLVRLVDDILSLERLQSGKVQLVMEQCQVAELMQQAVDSVQAIADQSGITLSLSSIVATLWAAPDAIIQTLTNLLSNAIKFSSTGDTVWLNAEVRRQASGVRSQEPEGEADREDRGDGGDERDTGTRRRRDAENSIQNSKFKIQNLELRTQNSPTPHSPLPTPHILFSIIDQGRGIPEDKLNIIFEQFQQVDVSDSRKKGGTGLGLAICKNIVQQHGGQIWVESSVGKGSTFYVVLPLMVGDRG
ncbi:PAS domain S-box protein (plasmid) [Kovacikia minuta CCNUW1]|uniref:PAS domain S-box protein n=1 Tax=Kovacikia minuta TaxID=2931930 RepID=UPI001CCFC3B1|nr:PAS domain S-box protein [Kovacikia minuta]UBF30011.1 PAS domain S-box protein [Kovacikia minuta CCNUW1]